MVSNQGGNASERKCYIILASKRYLLILLAVSLSVIIFMVNDPWRTLQYINNPAMMNLSIVKEMVEELSSLTTTTTPKATNNHYICPAFVGRAGNQLFIYASSFGIARMRDMQIVLNTDCELLRYFKITEADIKKDTSFCNSPQVKVIREGHSAVFDTNVTHFSDGINVRLTTYLQSYLYFDKFTDEIRNQLTFNDEIRTKAVSRLETYLQKYNISRYSTNRIHQYNKKDMYYDFHLTPSVKVTLVGVHIRRGDWIKEAVYGRLAATKEYFQSAVNWYEARYKHLVFLVASNGMDWAKANMPENRTIIYLEDNSSPWLDMATLTLCEHTIESVGSYSWWVGYLTGGNVTYFKWPAQEGTRMRKSFSKDYTDHFYPHWVGL